MDERAQQLLARELFADLEPDHPVQVLLRRAQAVDAGDAGDDDDVAPRQQRPGGAVPEPLDLLVDRGVLLDVGVGLRDVGLGLVVVVVRDEVLHRVVWQQLAQLVGELRRQRLVGQHDQHGPLQPLGHPRRGGGLAGAGGTHEHDVLDAGLHATLDLGDRSRLVAGRLVVRDHLKRRHLRARMSQRNGGQTRHDLEITWRLQTERPAPSWPGAFWSRAYFSRIATTPWPPAAQMEISARPEPRLVQQLRGVGHDAGAGGGERVGGGKGRALDVQLRPIDGAERRVEAELLLAERRVFPGGQRREHLAGEGLVDLVEVEVLQRQAIALQHARHGVGRCHQQAFGAADVVDGGDFVVDEVRLHLPAALLCFVLGRQQHGRRAIGQRRRVAGRHRGLVAEALAEDRLELGQRLDGGVGAQVSVLLDAAERGHQVVLPTVVPRLRPGSGATWRRARPGPRG